MMIGRSGLDIDDLADSFDRLERDMADSSGLFIPEAAQNPLIGTPLRRRSCQVEVGGQTGAD
jgi:hypothetical protein